MSLSLEQLKARVPAEELAKYEAMRLEARGLINEADDKEKLSHFVHEISGGLAGAEAMSFLTAADCVRVLEIALLLQKAGNIILAHAPREQAVVDPTAN